MKWLEFKINKKANPFQISDKTALSLKVASINKVAHKFADFSSAF